MHSVFLKLLRFLLCPNMWSLMENVLFVLGKCVFSAVVG